MHNRSFLEADSLCKHYLHANVRVPALKDVSLQIEKGDIYGIIGLSGAGKSTLLRCLSGLIAPCSGSVKFQDSCLGKLRGNALRSFRKKIGMIFQHFNLFSSRTVAENISYPLEIAGMCKEERKKRIDELLILVGLSSKQDVYPAFLSGGEKQRVGIARALACHPELLFCDEATSALDPKTTKEILDLLAKLQKQLGLTIVLITHDMEVIKRICNKVAVLEGGQVVEKGRIEEVFGDPQHATTRHFIQGISHELPEEFFHPPDPTHKLLRLRFKGGSAKEPLISSLVKKFNVDANILLGWIDRLKMMTVGTLVLELTGTQEGIQGALLYLSDHKVAYEVIEHYEP